MVVLIHGYSRLFRPLRWLVVFLTAWAIASAGSSAARSVETGDIEALRRTALALVNEDRRQHGLDQLKLTESLNEAAQVHAEDMLSRHYYSHVSPEGETVRDRYIKHDGNRWALVAENIARCVSCPSPPTVERVRKLQSGWMESPGHRRNILMEGLDSFGFGIVAGEGGTLYAVQTFAGPGTPRGLALEEEPIALAPAEQADRAISGINGAREQEGLPPLQPSAALAQAAAAILPDRSGDRLDLDQSGNLYQLIPDDARSSWQRLSVIAAGCGGCGTEPTVADIRYFRNQWLENPQYSKSLLDEQTTHIGFALRAYGEGRKVAVAVLGQRR